MTPQELLQLASQARNYAYAPYSKFQVGAALLTKNNRVFTGCNVENASYGLTNCAERSAVFNAISNGIQTFSAIAIAAPNGGAPCGACRQVLNEFSPNLKIYLGDENGRLLREVQLSELLPDAFGPENLS